ncbi:MAG TPA: discoidin domain-containing protein [Pyrinomonadaceae bacterium]|nr:discoidin domain-containing protein [Pyrinomonadaceae bacterium]
MLLTNKYLCTLFTLVLMSRFVGSAMGSSCATSVNVALASSGAVATASSSYDPNVCGSGPASANDGDRTGRARCSNHVWNDAAPANTFPDWLQIDFNGIKTITEIDVTTIQDHLEWPVEPTESMTFSLYGLTAFEVQYWNNSTWVTIPGGSVTGNNKVWRKFTFPAINTSKIRVLASASADGYSRIVELEAWTGPSPAPRYDLALGATATASTSYSGWGPSAVVNGDRKSLNAFSNGAWSSSGANNFPEWLEVNFGANKTINQVDIFTLQDNWASSTEPTAAMTFTLYGLSGYEVQYWTGSAWVTVPGGSVAGNNKIWRTFMFSPITTTKLRVLTSAAPDGVSRVTEIEAYGPEEDCSMMARLNPLNATGGGGENPLSRNFNWNLPLVSLPGRAGLDLNLTLSYNSLVWTKGTASISFDDDHGFPSPGFRLGYPTIQPAYINTETGKWSYLMIGSDGSRTELRSVSTGSVFYEAADSSHLLLDTTDLASSDPKMILRTTDGTQLTYKPKAAAYECTEIKDRNGNYITISYNSSGRIANIKDTLERTITFVYDNGWLTSIEQQWKQPSNASTTITHTWASFTYTEVPIATNFSSILPVSGPGSSLRALSKVTLDDNSTTASQNSRYEFAYISWGQVWKISNFAADNHLLNYRSYDLPQTATSAQSDCPRFSARRDWAEKWNQNSSGIEQEAVTTYSDVETGTAAVPGQTPQSATFVQVTDPDQTFTRIYFLGTVGSSTSGWRVGLPYLVDSYDVGGTIPQRQVMTTWTQDNESSAFILNPRVAETNIYDPAGNRKRVQVQYQSYPLGNGMSCQLPQDVIEYDSAGAVLRTTRTVYMDVENTPYMSRRIVGLPKETQLYEGVVSSSNLKSKREFIYDEAGSIDGNDAPVQHDTAYSSSFVSGRGNLSTVKRFDVDSVSLSQFTTSKMKYNTAGSLVSSKDALDNEVKVSYTDAFSDGINRITLAYPTKLTDPDGYYSTSRYNFDFGALTYRQTPPANYTGSPSSQPAGPEQTFEYYDHGRLKKQLNLVNHAYTMYVYESNGIRTNVNSTIQDGLGEAHSFTITDGAGRVIATAMENPDNPGKTGAYRAQRFGYDVVGRAIKTSNPAETNAVGNDPNLWATTDHDEVADWIYTLQSYDWKGRPTVTTNVDGTTKQVEYAGCGCAGGEVMTLMDEGTLIDGVNKRRYQKTYTDIVGRPTKTELYDFEGTGPGGSGRRLDSTTITTYNARDQVKMIRKFVGAAPNPDTLSCPTGTCQKTENTYDGYGRLKTQHVPEQNDNAVTTWTYNADDTLNTITDARGAVTTYGYTGSLRRLVKSITRELTGVATDSLLYNYDAAGNRVSMDHSVGGAAQDSIDYVYDQLSRLTSEAKTINALASNPSTLGNYTIGYQYTLSGNLKSVTDPFGGITNLSYDVTGRTTSVAGSAGGLTGTYIDTIGYRAWGGIRSVGSGSLIETRTYNRRLQPIQYRGASYRYDYTYYDDGRLKELIDLDDQVGAPSQVTFHYMSRLYTYDFLGRTSSVGGRTTPQNIPAPFVGNYGYDEFGNMNSRGGYYALNTSTAVDTATFVNDRRVATGWSYDADGRVLTSADTKTASSQTWNYDATGKSITITETISLPTPATTTTNTMRFDGNGELLFESVVSPTSTKSDYMINSTVLKTALTKLDASGNKDLTYAPSNGLGMFTQGKDLNGNPTFGGIAVDPSGLQEGGLAVDPFGARVRNVQPPDSSQQQANMHVFGPPYSGYGWSSFTDANNFSTGCTLDGVRTSCRSVLDALSRGLATGVVESPGTAASVFNMLGIVTTTSTSRTSRTVGPGNTIHHDRDGNAYPAYGTQRTETQTTTTISTEFVPIFGFDIADPPEPQNPQDPPGTPDYVNSQAVKACAERLFGITQAGLDYQPGNGRIGFQGFDEKQSSMFDSNAGWMYITPNNSLNSYQISQVTNAALKGGGGVAFGYTDPKDPRHPYVANDIAGSMHYRWFVHELGNALAFLTGKYHKSWLTGKYIYDDPSIRPNAAQISAAGEDDPGVTFSDCVRNYKP